MRAHDVAFVLDLLTGDRVLMALKWRLLLGLGDAHLSAFSVIRIYYQGWLVGAVLPSHLGGDLLRAYLVARWGLRRAAILLPMKTEGLGTESPVADTEGCPGQELELESFRQDGFATDWMRGA